VVKLLARSYRLFIRDFRASRAIGIMTALENQHFSLGSPRSDELCGKDISSKKEQQVGDKNSKISTILSVH
jgi:hypothetical protein